MCQLNIDRESTFGGEDFQELTGTLQTDESQVINLNMCSMNIQGLHKFQNDNIFLNYCTSFDIVGMYETWQRHEDDFRNFLNGYTNFDCIRHSRRQYAGQVEYQYLLKNGWLAREF